MPQMHSTELNLCCSSRVPKNTILLQHEAGVAGLGSAAVLFSKWFMFVMVLG